jgi:hypothetical protein
MVEGKIVKDPEKHSVQGGDTEQGKRPHLLDQFLSSYARDYLVDLIRRDGYGRLWDQFAEKNTFYSIFINRLTDSLRNEGVALASIQSSEEAEALVKTLGLVIFEQLQGELTAQLKAAGKRGSSKTTSSRDCVDGMSNMGCIDSVVTKHGTCINSTAQKIAVTGTALPPPPPPLPSFGVPGLPFGSISNGPPPPPPLPGMMGSCPRPKRASKVRAAHRLNSVHYLRKEGTFWSDKPERLDRLLEEALPADEFEKLFCTEEKGQKRIERRSSLLTRSNLVCLLDMQRSTNISIALKKFTSLEHIIQTMDEVDRGDYVDEDLLVALIQCEPTEDEVKLVKAFRGDAGNLNMPERFVLEFMTREMLGWKMRVLRRRAKIPVWLNELERATRMYEACYRVLLESRDVSEFLWCCKRLYDLNNTVYGTGRPFAGIAISGLLQLADKKSTQDPSISMIEYLSKNCGGLGKRLRTALPALHDACMIDSGWMQQTMAEATDSITLMTRRAPDCLVQSEFVNRLGRQYSAWSQQFEAVKESHRRMELVFEKYRHYFQEEDSDLTLTDHLRLWDQLIVMLERNENCSRTV